MTAEELRTHLGLEPGQLLQNVDGERADILSCDETHCTIGVIGTGKVHRVPLAQFVRQRPASSEAK